MDYLLGASLGGLIAFVVALPAIFIELADRKHKINLPLLVDVKEIWGHKITQPVLFWLALLNHLIMGVVFGLLYPVFVIKEWLYITGEPYTMLSILVYALHFWVVVMLVVFPVLGFGWFGKREGRLVWLEVLLTLLIIGVIMQLLIDWYRPFFFSVI